MRRARPAGQGAGAGPSGSLLREAGNANNAPGTGSQMTPHNEAKAGDFAEAVLLPGDPLRAKWIADTFLTEAKLVNSVRNCLGYTGSWKGKRVSVQASGMGLPSLAIYATELLQFYGAKTLIRIGTCGGLNRKIRVRDLVIAMTASTDSAMNDAKFFPFRYAPCADYGLVQKAVALAHERRQRVHVGGIVSSDTFYVDGGVKGYGALPDHGVLAVEMETAMLYTLAARFHAKALTVATMTDCLITGEQIDAGERQTSLKTMAELALDVATEAA